MGKIQYFSKQLKHLGIITSLLLISSLPALGQSGATIANISGRVSDEQGAVIGGAIVTAKSLKTSFIREVSVDAEGIFQISQLPPDRYEVAVTASGFTTKVTSVELVLGSSSLVNFTLQTGQTTEVIEVNGDSLIDNSQTESSSNNNRQRIADLPINRRSFLDFSLTTPRVTPDRTPTQGVLASSGFSFNGQTARANNITVDGLDNNDLTSGSALSTFSQDAVQEFQVISDGYSAEFGRALAGVVNIVTRSGGNEYHGNLFFLNRNDKISARDAFAPFKPDYAQYQFGSSLNGPIKRNKLFFFAAFERLSIKQNNIVSIPDNALTSIQRLGFNISNGIVPFGIGTTSLLTRVDGKFTPNNTFWVRYTFGGENNGAVEDIGALVAGNNTDTKKLQDNALAFNNTYVNGRLNLVNETRFLFSNREQTLDPLENTPQVQLAQPEGLVSFGGFPFTPQPRDPHAYQIVNNTSLVRSHQEIKFGVDYRYGNSGKSVPFFPRGFALFTPIDFAQAAGIPGLPSFSALQNFDPQTRTPAQQAFLMTLTNFAPSLFPGFPSNIPFPTLSLPAVYIQGFGNSNFRTAVNQFGAFVQDSIKIGTNLVINAGVRYDNNNIKFIPTNNGNIAPRLGIAYQPSKLPKLSVRASYGLFVGTPLAGPPVTVDVVHSGKYKIVLRPFPFSVLPFALPGRGFAPSQTLPPGVTFQPTNSQDFQYEPNARSSYSQQASLSLTYLIDKNTLISVGYNYVRGLKLFSQRPFNPVVRPNDKTGNGRVDPSRGLIDQFESSADSYYNGLTILLNHRLAHNFGLLASYTFAKAIDNQINFSTTAQQIPVDPLKPGDERGISLQDVRSRFILSGTWDLNYGKNPLLKGFQLSSIINVESGRPYNLLAGVDLNQNGDNGQGDRPLEGGVSIARNRGITPGLVNVDLRLLRNITFKESLRLQVFVETFNLFNRANINKIDNIFSPDSQGNFNLPPKEGGRFTAPKERYRSAFAPRQFQIGVRFNF